MFTIRIKCLLGTALHPSGGHGYFALFLTTTSFTHFWMSQKIIVFHVIDEHAWVIGKILWHYISTKLLEKKKTTYREGSEDIYINMCKHMVSCNLGGCSFSQSRIFAYVRCWENNSNT